MIAILTMMVLQIYNFIKRSLFSGPIFYNLNENKLLLKACKSGKYNVIGRTLCIIFFRTTIEDGWL